MYDLSGKVVVVTGAASGIGRALAQTLAARGCRLALADVNEAGLAETAALLPAGALLQRLDVADRAAVEAFAQRVERELGAADVVINNAGVTLTGSPTVQKLDYADFEWLMGINFWGVVYGTKAFLPAMVARNSGAIVNISSAFGIVAWHSQSAYNAAKFAVRGFTEALRHELTGSGVKAICVYPGGVSTSIVRNARFYADDRGAITRDQVEAQAQRMAWTSPAQAAETIVRAIERGRVKVLVGLDAHLVDFLQRVFSVSYHAVIGALVGRGGRRKPRR